LLPALFIGIVTVLAPLLILQPALGAGIASTKTAKPVFNSMKSVVTHTVYGVGLYLAALATASLLPAGKMSDADSERPVVGMNVAVRERGAQDRASRLAWSLSPGRSPAPFAALVCARSLAGRAADARLPRRTEVAGVDALASMRAGNHRFNAIISA
jgi:hypothetical protein